ncbi:MAG: hypothetical protein JWM90_1676 [Thermoleophilia bacterium]|nr:hypothetical protein [Thermoleophilia bacterium]
MVEIVVVVLILGVVLATMVGANRSTSRATSTQQAVAVAQVYADSIEAFADDHGGRAPVPGSLDWPRDALREGDAPARPQSQPFEAGPRNVAASNRRYLRQVPDPIKSSSVGLVAQTGAAPNAAPSSGAAGTRAAYISLGGAEWRIDVDVWMLTGDGRGSWRTSCSIGTAAPAGGQRC